MLFCVGRMICFAITKYYSFFFYKKLQTFLIYLSSHSHIPDFKYDELLD